MPELPEVETVRRTLENFILNKKIEDIKILYSKIIDDDQEEFVQTLKNIKMKKVIISLVLFLLCGCFPQSYQNIENKFKQDTCFKYHYQLLNKNQKQLYQTI